MFMDPMYLQLGDAYLEDVKFKNKWQNFFLIICCNNGDCRFKYNATPTVASSHNSHHQSHPPQP
jgi:hypothetical protein